MLILVTSVLIILYILLDDKKYLKYGLAISIIFIGALFAFRDNIGVDDQHYQEIFEAVKQKQTVNDVISVPNIEKSFLLISKFLSILNLNYKSVFFVYASIGFLSLYFITKKMQLSKKETLMWLLCFLAFSLTSYITVLRQFPASLMAIYATMLFDTKNKKNCLKSIILFIASIAIHMTAIIVLPLLIIKKTKFIRKKWFLIFFPIFCMILNIAHIWDILPSIAPFLPKINAYTAQNGIKTDGNIIIVIALYVIYIINLLLYRQKNENINTNEATQNYIELFSLAYFALFFLTRNNGAIYRIMFPFILFRAASLITITNYINNALLNKIISIITICCLCFASQYAVQSNKMNFGFENYSLRFIGDKQNEQ